VPLFLSTVSQLPDTSPQASENKMTTPTRRTTRTATKAQRMKCYILTLPTEILHMILLNALPTAEAIHPRCNAEGLQKRLKELEIVLALARTCRQLCAEALPIYYSRNTFHFADMLICKIVQFTLAHSVTWPSWQSGFFLLWSSLASKRYCVSRSRSLGSLYQNSYAVLIIDLEDFELLFRGNSTD
jgi:hypothetical protein